jgi:hypothetical protein
MQRREFLAVLGGAAAWPMAVRAQTPGRTYRVGYLARGAELPAFLDELRLAGFVEGQNLRITYAGSRLRPPKVFKPRISSSHSRWLEDLRWPFRGRFTPSRVLTG